MPEWLSTEQHNHSYWAYALEPEAATAEACVPWAQAPQQEKHHNEKPVHHN